MPVCNKIPEYTVADCGCFSLSRTLDCGQCFRWKQDENGVWSGVAGGKYIEARTENGALILSGVTETEYNAFWHDYFDLGRDYSAVDRLLCTDEKLKEASQFAAGIHILRQEPWETLCSFIISQNNNIPRISGIVSRLCENFGEPLGGGRYAFPTAEVMAGLCAEDYAPLRAGFRVRYIMDAARRVANGEIDFDYAASAPIDSAREHLMTITGVGTKVADCTLLYGCGRIDAFPRDVWIKRIMAELFPDGLPERFSNVGGIAQQYLFHYARTRNMIK